MNNNSVYKEASMVSGIIFLLGFIEFIFFTVFLSFRIDILAGVLYGCSFACANFFYMAYSVKKSVEKEEKRAQAYMSASYMIRMLLTAAMVIIAVKVEQIHLWAAIIPLFFLRVAIYIRSFISTRNRKGSEIS